MSSPDNAKDEHFPLHIKVMGSVFIFIWFVGVFACSLAFFWVLRYVRFYIAT